MFEIDVHCLIHKQSPYYFLLEEQMLKEECNFFPIQNGEHIGKGRATGFLLGSSPYVSYVDYDDLVQPGIFKEIAKLFKQGYDWIYTDEMLIGERGESLQPGWSSHPNLYPPELLSFVSFNKGRSFCHHLIAFRRSCLNFGDLFILRQLKELSEPFLYRVLGQHQNYFHLPEVGYYWRQYEEQGCRQFEAFRALSEKETQDASLRC